MDKIIIRAALRTLAAIGVLLVFLSLSLCLIFPSTMMYITYDLGMDGASVKYGMRAYRNTEDITYVAFATETAIGVDAYEEIESCGSKLIAHEDFAQYCKARDDKAGTNDLYKQYVYGQVAFAQYRLGRKSAALSTSMAALGEHKFPENNAFVALALNALMANDSEMIAMLKNQIAAIDDGLSAADKACLDRIVELLG